MVRRKGREDGRTEKIKENSEIDKEFGEVSI